MTRPDPVEERLRAMVETFATRYERALPGDRLVVPEWLVSEALEAAGVPALLAETERQRVELERLRGALEKAQEIGAAPIDSMHSKSRQYYARGQAMLNVILAALATPETPEGETPDEA